MRKIAIGGVLLLVATIVTLFVILKVRSPFGKNNSSFASEPKSEITKIELSDKERNLYLEKEGDEWLINGKLETRKSSLFFMEKVLKEIKIKSPVSTELFDKEITEKGILPVRVKVYEKRRLLNTFLVYKTRSNIYGNIMMKNESAKPFIVYVPGYDDDIGSGFTLSKLFWQPYTVFSLLPSEIFSVKFENLSDTTSSFLIVGKHHQYTLSGTTGGVAGWDSTLVTRYLSYFIRVPFERWALELGDKEKSNIESEQPLYRISVVTTEGLKTDLILWERITGKNGAKDSDRLWGKTQNSEEFFIMRYFDIDPLIKKRSYFFPK
ncbi:MAG TPA: hypothetical protein VMV77_20215 [Bacteroidales bacterium]|nr:hypothetical protein [Bacteroidales bacterium]